MTIRLFIGTSANGEDTRAERAYESSLREHASEELEIVWMRQSNDPTSFWHGWNTDTWATPFSGFRWGIAEYCNFEGRAIYTDVDMINLKDIALLNQTDMKGKPIAAREGTRFGGHEFCVMVIDCAVMKHFMNIPLARFKSQAHSHQRMIQFFSGDHNLVESLDPRWNCLDGENRSIDDIWQLHFTNMSTQPWKPAWFKGPTQTHPRDDLVSLWESYANNN